MNLVPGYILAGGKSRRFGSDKARALLDGLPLILHAARQIKPHVSSVTVVADAAGKYEDLGLKGIADRRPGLGPLGGILTALDDVEDEGWILVASCDLPVYPPGDLERLIQAGGGSEDAVAFRDHDGWQPFPLLLSASCWDAAEELLSRGRGSLRGLLEQLRVRSLEASPGWRGAGGANRPEDLAVLNKGRA